MVETTGLTGNGQTLMMHGRGKLVHTNGNIYEGEFQDDQYHGHGRHETPQGTIRSGNWEAGLLHG